MEKVCIYIDGGNFYHLALKKLGISEKEFDFDAFLMFLIGEKRIVAEMGKRYYVGTIREKVGDERSKKAMALQTSFFARLKSSRWEIKTSKLRTRIEEIPIDQRVHDFKKIQKLGVQSIKIERLREKGIDVKLATDLIVGAVDNKYDTAIIVSSDGDLVPAIDWVRHRFKKKIEYVGFSIIDPKNPNNSTRPLLSMIPKTDIQRTLTAEDLKPFIIQKLKILFICKGNVGRSQIAEALFKKKYAKTYEVSSAGLKLSGPEQPIAELIPNVKEVLDVMNEEGIDVSKSVRVQLTDKIAENADVIVVLIEDGEALPDYLEFQKVIRWNIADPKGKDLEFTRNIKDEIKNHIENYFKKESPLL